MPSRTTTHPDSASNVIPALQDPNSAVSTILSGRKCWRILKGRNEPVWPPQLEAALIEGLHKYRPTGTRSTKALGRLPMRNKFVSDYIFETTGKRRTPKQVGSRIQQLRDTNSGKQIVKVLSDQHYDMLRPTRSISDEDAINDAPAIVERPVTKFVEIPVSPPGEEPHMNEYRHVYPHPLRELDPSVTFLSATKINCYSHFTIYHHTAPISHETTYPSCQPAPAESNARYMYTTTLAPKFWPKLCSCQDPTQYSISQEIFREDGNQMLSSVVYHFVFASSPSSSTRSISPASVDDGCSIDYAPSVSGSSNHGAELEPFISHSSSPIPHSMVPIFGAPENTLLYSQPHQIYSPGPFGSEPASPLNANMSNLLISSFPQDTHIASNTSAPFHTPDEVFFSSEQDTSCYNSSIAYPTIPF